MISSWNMSKEMDQVVEGLEAFKVLSSRTQDMANKYSSHLDNIESEYQRKLNKIEERLSSSLSNISAEQAASLKRLEVMYSDKVSNLERLYARMRMESSHQGQFVKYEEFSSYKEDKPFKAKRNNGFFKLPFMTDYLIWGTYATPNTDSLSRMNDIQAME
eukprot:TRINITY_DN5957_c0_g1_i1.p1 TRINITY_DN5957_c0_g1~~TRINITY_DN5957_c0_g1_i1.p1  ORF type:complete len:160 (+),score=50.24 TRINITY_DN5957_c0_g1_i1:51-530(+)